MLQFMGENKKLLNFHEQKFAELEASNTNSQIFQTTTNASLKNLETQIGQLALTLQNQIKDTFPSDKEKSKGLHGSVAQKWERIREGEVKERRRQQRRRKPRKC